MSNSNYSIGLRHLKPVHTAYCCFHNMAENWSWARDINGRDRDETETLTIFLERKPRRNVGTSRDRDVETETTTLAMSEMSVRLSVCPSVCQTREL